MTDFDRFYLVTSCIMDETVDHCFSDERKAIEAFARTVRGATRGTYRLRAPNGGRIMAEVKV
jgi:hypothetical protein